jgi:hypothetical protein
MQTTLDIDDDVLALARARRPRARVDRPRHLAVRPHGEAAPSVATTTRNGLPVLPNAHTAGTVMPELVNQMRDAAP